MRIEIMKGISAAVVAVSMGSIIPVPMTITGEVVVITSIEDTTTVVLAVPLMVERNAAITKWRHLFDNIRYHPKDTCVASAISQDIGFKLVQPKTILIIIINVK
jgi:hypothetical protein